LTNIKTFAIIKLLARDRMNKKLCTEMWMSVHIFFFYVKNKKLGSCRTT